MKWQDWEEHIINSSTGSIPSLDTMLTLLMQFYLDKMKDKSAKPSSSDGADLLHAGYAPYCDIFRADKRMVELARKVSKFIGLKETNFLKNPDDNPLHLSEGESQDFHHVLDVFDFVQGEGTAFAGFEIFVQHLVGLELAKLS